MTAGRGAAQARLRPEEKRARALPRRDRPPPAAERGRGGGACQAGRAWRPRRQQADDQGQPAPRRLDRQALSRPRRSLSRPDPGGRTGLNRAVEKFDWRRLQVLDLCPLVDPPRGRAHDCEPGEDEIRLPIHVIERRQKLAGPPERSRPRSAATRAWRNSPRRPACRRTRPPALGCAEASVRSISRSAWTAIASSPISLPIRLPLTLPRRQSGRFSGRRCSADSKGCRNGSG